MAAAALIAVPAVAIAFTMPVATVAGLIAGA
jgi:hypothetical protein